MATKRKRRKRRRLRLGRMLIVLMIPAALCAGIYMIYLNFHPVQLIAKDVVVEYKEKYDPRSNIKFVFGGNKDEVKIEGKIDTNKKGEYPISYSFKNHKSDALINVKDTKAPQLTLKDVTIDMVSDFDPSMVIEKAEDAGKIKYTYDYDKTTIDERGKHQITVTAVDEEGNETKKDIHMYREEDTKAPTLKDKKATLTIKQGQDVTDSMIEAKDDYDPAPTIEIDTSSYNSKKAGESSVDVTLTDQSGNSQTVTIPLVIEKDPAYGKKVVYLTFDDGPSENTKKILDILDKYDAKATFFVTGNHPEYNNYMKEAANEGHTIGLHTYTHDYSTVYSSKDAYFEDLQNISDMVEDVTGEKSMVIRFPGGSSNMISAQYTPGIMSELTEEVRQKGYQYFDWNVDSTDASGNNVPVSQIVQNATGSDEQYINILMHDTDAKDTTVEALEEIIKYYKDQGYIFLGLDTSSYPAHHETVN